MAAFNYFLDQTNYTWKNAFLWGNCVEHFKKTNEGSLGDRSVHALISAIEFLPVISQISSICEKLIADNIVYSSSFSKKQFPPDKRFALIEDASESSEEFKINLLNNLSTYIEEQQKHPTYSRSALEALSEHDYNLPITISSLPQKVKYYSEDAIYYGYNAEGIRDYGWGCAWRAIQTCLSGYKIIPSFEELFHLFGPYENLKHIYEDKYAGEELSNTKCFAPYELYSGWAEPFIGHMVMHFYDIPSELETVNALPESCHAPEHVFHHEPLGFNSFKERLENHFTTKDAAPVMIDDGTYALNIIGMETEGEETVLWIADPHINEGVNQLVDVKQSPVGIYKVILDAAGRQIECSLADEDRHQVSGMFSAGSYKGLHFESKSWMVLFPLRPPA